MKKHLVSLLMTATLTLIATTNLKAGDNSNFQLGADLVSRYVWRGMNLGGAGPHIQPFIEYEAGNSGLAFGFWGSYGIGAGSTGTEADLYLSYTPVDYFTLTINDYFFPSDIPFGRDSYFNYKNQETDHTIELMASFNGTEKLPVSLLFAINIYGADGLDENGDSYYAKYLELGYSGSTRGFDYETFIGVALDNPKTELGANGWYGNSSGIINLGFTLSKEVNFSETVQIPTFSSLIVNPEAGTLHMVIGVSF